MRVRSLIALTVACAAFHSCGDDNAATPNVAPVVTITSPLDGQSFTEGTAIGFQGSATDREDGTLSGADLVWSSDIDGQVGTGETVTTTGLSVNSHVITLTATDSGGRASRDQITVAVLLAAAPAIEVVPGTLELSTQTGGEITATLTVRNVGTSTLSISQIADDAEWLSESPTVFLLPAGGDTAVTVTASAVALDAGVYESTIGIASNDPEAALTSVSVTLTVTGGVTPLIEMIQISGGTFQMGSTYYGAGSDELPVHSVTLSGFQLSTYEVTQSQYQQVTGVNPSSFIGPNRPVERVNWWEAARFCNALSEREGLTKFYNEDDLTSGASVVRMTWDATGYRLPTEAEWEYAYRANSTTEFPWGNSVDGRYCWYSANSGGQTHDVGTRLPNNRGLYDMGGSVWEWCNDWKETYSAAPQTDPVGPAAGMDRMVRGGSWNYVPECCRSAFRGGYPPGDRFADMGFRVARR